MPIASVDTHNPSLNRFHIITIQYYCFRVCQKSRQIATQNDLEKSRPRPCFKPVFEKPARPYDFFLLVATTFVTYSDSMDAVALPFSIPERPHLFHLQPFQVLTLELVPDHSARRSSHWAASC